MNPSAQHSTLCHSEKSVVMSNSQLSSFMNRTYCLLNKYLTVSACQKAHSGACSNFGMKQGMLFDTIMVLLVIPVYSPLMMWTIYFNLWTTILTGSSMNCRSYSAITDSFPFTTRPSTESFPCRNFLQKAEEDCKRKKREQMGRFYQENGTIWIWGAQIPGRDIKGWKDIGKKQWEVIDGYSCCEEASFCLWVSSIWTWAAHHQWHDFHLCHWGFIHNSKFQNIYWRGCCKCFYHYGLNIF